MCFASGAFCHGLAAQARFLLAVVHVPLVLGPDVGHVVGCDIVVTEEGILPSFVLWTLTFSIAHYL